MIMTLRMRYNCATLTLLPASDCRTNSTGIFLRELQHKNLEVISTLDEEYKYSMYYIITLFREWKYL